MDEESNQDSLIFDDPPTPPDRVFKYLSPERIDVLEHSRIRFTPLMGTNDSFEVRKTFKSIFGGKFRSALISEMNSQTIDEAIRDRLVEMGVDPLVAAAVSKDPAVQERLRTQISGLVDNFFIPQANASDMLNRFFEFVGSFLALSLAEEPTNAAMWAHYASNSLGFVVEFDTANDFFNFKSNGDRRLVQKIEYFDGELNELVDDPRKALMSKTAVWSYEKEWRLYAKPGEADSVLNFGIEAIHLFNFPLSAVSGIIVGSKASPGFVDEIISVRNRIYPHAYLRQIMPDKVSSKFIYKEV